MTEQNKIMQIRNRQTIDKTRSGHTHGIESDVEAPKSSEISETHLRIIML
jgi:hypothetical protein